MSLNKSKIQASAVRDQALSLLRDNEKALKRIFLRGIVSNKDVGLVLSCLAYVLGEISYSKMDSLALDEDKPTKGESKNV